MLANGISTTFIIHIKSSMNELKSDFFCISNFLRYPIASKWIDEASKKSSETIRRTCQM